jgi:hypothetical protein
LSLHNIYHSYYIDNATSLHITDASKQTSSEELNKLKEQVEFLRKEMAALSVERNSWKEKCQALTPKPIDSEKTPFPARALNANNQFQKIGLVIPY